MGLLTNPSFGSGGLFSVIERFAGPLSWLAYVAGVTFFFVFAYSGYSHQTYFSENALLPGLVQGHFGQEANIHRYFEALKEESAAYPNSIPFPWIEAQFRQLGLEVYKHNFTVDYPLGKSKSFTGENLYAILRAPRASSTESLILSAPYRPPQGLDPSTETSVAVILGMAKFFQKQNFWAKDIIFLITQHEQLGIQAWLEAYHQRSCGSGALHHGDLEARAGSIQAALNLELSSPKLTHLNIKLEGLNGQLPNLDLVNLVNRLCSREGVGKMFQGMEEYPRSDTLKGYVRSLQTLLSMAAKQATGIPSGNHGLFHRFGIEAITLEGLHQKTKRRYDINFHTLGRIIEDIYRSLNNLLERFHQSFFFYLLPSSSRYVSIGMYMPAFGLLGGSLVLVALALWRECILDEWLKVNTKQAASNGDQKPEKKQGEEGSSDETANDEDPVDYIPVVIPATLSETLPILILAHGLGFLLLYLPKSTSHVGAYFEFEVDDSIFLGLLAYCVYSAALPYFMRRSIVSANAKNWKMVKTLTLLELAVLGFTVALSNFSLAFFTLTLYTPFALLVAPMNRSRKFSTVFKLLQAFVTHPLVLIACICLIDTMWTFPNNTILERLRMSIEATTRALTYSIVDNLIYGSTTYRLAALHLYPCWHLLYSIIFATEEPLVVEFENQAEKDPNNGDATAVETKKSK